MCIILLAAACNDCLINELLVYTWWRDKLTKISQINMAKNFPRLPYQNEFLLSLHNNNYSKMTILNYARDLSILAVFLYTHKIEFSQLNKQKLDLYKGYLRDCRHLEDLEQVRSEISADYVEETMKKPSATGKDETSRSDASNFNEKEKVDIQHLLEEIYKKVWTGPKAKSNHARSHSNHDSQLDAKSINRMLTAFRSYLRYLIDLDKPYPLAPDSVKLMKTTKRKKRLADFDELVKLIEFPTSYEKDRRVALRNRAMLEMLFASGMRISELMSLSLDDINVAGKLFITGKGKKQRFVYLTPRALQWLDLYLVVRLKWELDKLRVTNHKSGDADRKSSAAERNLKPSRETNKRLVVKHKRVSKIIDDALVKIADGYDGTGLDMVKLVEQMRREDLVVALHSPALFVPFSGRSSSDRGCTLSTNYFQEKIAEYRRRVGILVPTSAHSLRHGFATYLAENGATVVALQVLLGHESLNTTTRYVHASDRLAQEEHRKGHPLG